MSHNQTIIATLTLCLVAAGLHRCQAGITFLGPIPYLSKADSPFPVDGSNPNFYLEDFEPPSNLPPSDLIVGKFSPPGATREWGSIGAYWSVGQDDHVDGSGRNGWSGAVNVLMFTGTESEIDMFIVQFDASSLGYFPTAVGFVVTRGSPVHTGFSIYDPTGIRTDFSLKALDLSMVSPGGGQFFGVIDQKGISRIEIGQTIVYSSPTEPLRFDHFQYGLIVPERSTTATLIVATVLLLFTQPPRAPRIT